MTVAVVIPCRNEAATIGALLDAVASQTHAVDEVLVVDDRSTDATLVTVAAWATAHPERPLVVVQGPGRGPGAAMNAGIRSTTCEVIVRLDGHSIPQPDYVATALAVLDDPSVAVAGGVWLIEPGAPTRTARAIAAVVGHWIGSGGAAYRHAHGPEVRRDVETVPFGVYRRSLWVAVGGYDETLVANEDFDFNHRARKRGGVVRLDRRTRVVYLARPTLLRLWQQYFRYGFWKCQMLRKSPGAIHPRQLAPALLAPWLGVTLVSAVLAPTGGTLAAAALYPLGLAGAAAAFAARGHSAVATAAAVACVHVGWSVGFWTGLVARRATPQSS